MKSAAHLPYLLDAGAAEAALQPFIADISARYLGADRLEVRLKTPDREEVECCLRMNATLTMTVAVSSKTCGHLTDIRVPYPYHGVFIWHSWSRDKSEQDRPRLQIWHPCLVTRPGLWLIRRRPNEPEGEDESDETDLPDQEVDTEEAIRDEQEGEEEPSSPRNAKSESRVVLGLSCGRRCSGDGESRHGERSDRKKSRVSILDRSATLRQLNTWRNNGKVLDELKSYLGDPSHAVIVDSEHDDLRNMLEKIWSNRAIEAADMIPMDRSHLGYQRLYTYSAFLAENVAQLIAYFLETARPQAEGRESQRSPERLAGSVDEFAQTFLYRMSPPKRLATPTASSDQQPSGDGDEQLHAEHAKDPGSAGRRRNEVGFLRDFRPLNGIDALSTLTSLNRSYAPSEVMEQYSRWMRQNHPSFRGVICPVDTPESGMVGNTLHTAVGVEVDCSGTLSRSQTDAGALGYAASMLPFYGYNDAARSMMAAKNFVQALPVEGAENAILETGYENEMEAALSDLRDIGILPQAPSFYRPGKNLLVAYMPWFGWNYEDAIVANENLLESLAFTENVRFAKYIFPGYSLAWSDVNSVAFQFRNRLRSCLMAGIQVVKGDALAIFRSTDNRLSAEVIAVPDDGEVTSLKFTSPQSPRLGGLLEWTMKLRYPLDIGSKLMGRHGNKGIISLLSPRDKLPRLPQDERLGTLSGKAVDLVLNPHGVISRMNLGQLLETQVGLLMKLGAAGSEDGYDGAAYNHVKLDDVATRFLSLNHRREPRVVDRYGRMYLTLPDGSLTKAPVTVGYQYMLRLSHIAERKANVRGRAKGAYDLTTGQPVKGKKRRGGQALGRMEMWALASYDANVLLDFVLADDTLNIVPTGAESQTFRAIADFFFALGIKLEQEHGKYCLVWATPDELRKKGSQVHNAGCWKPARRGYFVCEKCNYEIPKKIIASGRPQRSGQYSPTLEDVFRHHHLVPVFPDNGNDPVEPGTTELDVYFYPVDDSEDSQLVHITVRRDEKGYSVWCNLEAGYHAWKRTKKDLRKSDLFDLFISCPSRHYLVCRSGGAEAVQPYPGGLAEPAIFGSREETGWGWIELPAAVNYPLETKPSAPAITYLPVLPLKYRSIKALDHDSADHPDALTSRYIELLRATQKHTDVDAGGSKSIRNLVTHLCAMIRERLVGKDGLIRSYGLRRRIDASGRLTIVPDPKIAWDCCAIPPEALLELYRQHIAEWFEAQAHNVRANRKSSLPPASVKAIRSSPQRIPPQLQSIWDYDWSRIIGQLERSEVIRILNAFLRSARPLLLVNRTPTLHRYNMKVLIPKLIDNEAHPDRRSYVLKISPLICSSMGADFDGDEFAVYALPSEWDLRNCLPSSLRWIRSSRLPPHWEAVTVYRNKFPAMLDARRTAKKVIGEFRRLCPSHFSNLLSLANSDSVASFDQDFVLGHFLISRDDKQKARFRSMIAISHCGRCAEILGRPEWDKDHGRELLHHLFEAHPAHGRSVISRWMTLAFDVVTRHGVSFGMLELEACRPGTIDSLVQNARNPTDTRGDWSAKANREIADGVLKRLQEIVASGDVTQPGFGFALLAVSGARGREQTRQIVGSRGYLLPGDVDFSKKDHDFFIDRPLLHGMTPSQCFWAAMNGRSSMIDKQISTRESGAFMDLLVLACRPWIIVAGDCGCAHKKPHPGYCQSSGDRTICSTCYGVLPDGKSAPIAFPAGLVAAQSIGERSTQLAMQGFHTGRKAVHIETIRHLCSPDHKDTTYEAVRSPVGCEQFTDAMQEHAAYRSLDKRHLQLLWRVIRDSPEHSLVSAARQNRKTDLFAGLIGKNQWDYIQRALVDRVHSDVAGEWGRILIGLGH